MFFLLALAVKQYAYDPLGSLCVSRGRRGKTARNLTTSYVAQELKKKGDKDKLAAEKIIAVWDTDKSGAVDFAAFSTRMTEYLKKHPEGRDILTGAAMEK